MPELGLGFTTYAPANGESGIVFERTCESSYVLAPGSAICQAQRCSVAGPICLALPRSLPAGKRGAGTLRGWSITGSAGPRGPSPENLTNRAKHLIKET